LKRRDRWCPDKA